MLQVVLAFLAITIVSATGFSLVEQIAVQQRVAEQREDVRRLDALAKNIEANLISIPGENGLFAPAPGPLSPNGWSTAPAIAKGIKNGSNGLSFMYCPLARRATTGANGLPVVNGPSEEFKIEVNGGAVVASDLVSPASSSGVIAFVVSLKSGVRPNCSDIQFSGSKFIAPNAIVRPIFDNGSTGIGLRPGDTRVFVGNGISLDNAIAHWILHNPQTFDIIVSGNVSVSDASVWASFLNEAAKRRSQLSFSAADGSNSTISLPSSFLNVSGDLILRSSGGSLSISGANFVIKQGGQVSTQGSIAILGSSGAPAVAVEQGGRLNSVGILSMSGMSGSAINGILSAGDVSFSNADIYSNGQWTISLANGGRLNSASSIIGSNVNSVASVISAGGWSISSDSGSSVRVPTSGNCWLSSGSNDVTFVYSNNGVGAVSSVLPDSAAPSLSDPATPEELISFQDWRREVDAKQRARQSNNSSFQCI